MSVELAKKECVPCKGGVEKLTVAQIKPLLNELGNGWDAVDNHHLEKTYKFKDFVQALAFTNTVGEIAEEQNHHPDILTTYGKTSVTIWTHTIDGLTESDFVFAAKVEEAHKSHAM